MRSETTGRIVPKTCKSWLCQVCNPWLRDVARQVLAAGALRRPSGFEPAFLTFTEPPDATLDLPAYAARCERTVKRLRRQWGVGAYAYTTEMQKRGALHPHFLIHWPTDRVELLRDHGVSKRDRAQYRFHFGELVPMARELGWGPVCDAEQVSGTLEAAEYSVKSLGRYATKQAYTQLKQAGVKRVRPIRHSHSWPASFGAYLQGKEATDPGPWVDVTQLDRGFARG
jgi:hypothetical protein